MVASGRAQIHQVEWRIHALAAQIDRQSGKVNDADENLAKARELQLAVADTISNPGHRAQFLEGRVAQFLGLA